MFYEGNGGMLGLLCIVYIGVTFIVQLIILLAIISLLYYIK